MILESQKQLRQRLASDPHRPRYHFLSPANWMNDPNGFIQWKGQYHLFYQYNPNSALWGDIHWGHAVSPDLIHWSDLPIALAPTPGSYDEAGCYSGCAVDNGLPTIIYTGTVGPKNEIQTQCIATSQDDLLTWQKHANNPVIGDVPPESKQTRDFRDPFVWKEGDTWYLVLASRIDGNGGAIFLYRSKDLIDWEYLNPLLIGDRARDGICWECPNFFKIDQRWVLIVSTIMGGTTPPIVRYFVGAYENFRFSPTYEGILDYGRLYAPLTTVDHHGRRLLMGWLREARPNPEIEQAGWAGVQSIPRNLSLDSYGRLAMVPVAELEQIHGEPHHWANLDLAGYVSLDVEGLALDIVAEFEPQPDGQCGLSLLCSPDGTERLDIVYEATKQVIVVNRITPEHGSILAEGVLPASHQLDTGETLRLRVLLDGSVVEIIANDRTSVTSRVYPSHPDHTKLRLFGTQARLRLLDIWEMPSIWQSR